MAEINWSDANRDPSANPTPLDWASFYVEELKYGPGPGNLEVAAPNEVVAELEALLRDAGITSMTGEELAKAMTFYGVSLSKSLRIHRMIASSLFLDGLMHGIAFGAGLKGSHRRSQDEG